MTKAIVVLFAILLAALPHVPNSYALAAFMQSLPLGPYTIVTIMLVLTSIWYLRALGRGILIIGLLFSWSIVAVDTVSYEQKPADGIEEIDVITWNTHYWDQTDGDREFISQLKALDSDVLLLQEHVYWNDESRALEGIKRSDILKRCCEFENVWTKGELVIASKLPGISIPTSDPFVQAVSIGEGESRRMLVNVHVPVHVDISLSPLRAEFWEFIRDRKQPRLNTFHALGKILDGPGAVIVGGDFNSTVLMPSFRSALLRHSNFQITDLSLLTYPARKPLPAIWRLDYLLGNTVEAKECEVLHLPNVLSSDHWPVRCTFGGAS